MLVHDLCGGRLDIVGVRGVLVLGHGCTLVVVREIKSPLALLAERAYD